MLLFAERLLLYEIKGELYADHFFIRDSRTFIRKTCVIIRGTTAFIRN
jgi:hypothetical protein